MKTTQIEIKNNCDYSVINGRDIIYLDMNIWIDLADEKTQLSKNLQDIIRVLVNDKKIFCPLHFSVLSELYTQNYDSMLRVAQIMHEFSLNFSFSKPERIYTKEIETFLYSHLHNNKYTLSNEIKFIPYAGYLSSSGLLIFPDEAGDNYVREASKLLKEKITKMTLPEMVIHSNGFKERKKIDYSNRIRSEWQKIWEHTKGNNKIIREENENFIAKKKLLPVIFKINSKLASEDVSRVKLYINSFQKDNKGRAFNSIIDNIPTLRNEVEIFSIAPLDNNRKITMNDFYDLESIAVPLAYSDVFVARDGWIRHLFEVSDLPKKNNCVYLYSLHDFIEFLSENYLRN